MSGGASTLVLAAPAVSAVSAVSEMQAGVTPSAGESVAFWICAVVAVVAALGMVFNRRAVYSALMLAVVMLCLAGLYAVQEAPFLAFVQVIVYTGAIMMLFLFVLMLVGVDSSDSLIETLRGQRVWVAVAGIGFGVLLVGGLGSAVTQRAAGLAQVNSAGNVQELARLMFTKYVFAFEATSALLITAALGAMVLAHREQIGPKMTQQELSTRRFSGPNPSPLPSSGVYARHNGVDMPALLPDGTAADGAVSTVLVSRQPEEPGSPAEREQIAVPPTERNELDLPRTPGKGESQ